MYNSSFCSLDAGVLLPYRRRRLPTSTAGVDDSDGSVSYDSNYAEDDYDDGMMLLKTPAVPPTNIENKMFAGKIPNPLPVSNPDPAERQLMIQTYKRERDEDGDNQDDLRGSSEYLFEYSRIDIIITDVYYDPFTSAKDFKLSVKELGHFVKGSEDNV